ncbi:ferredoxin reductase [Streptomyces albidoflavus]
MRAPALWRVAVVAEVRQETADARTLVLAADGWPGHLAGQHVDLRLTAEDGYQAVRSYSLCAPADGARLEVSVQPVADGEVSPYLAGEVRPGDELEVRGPLGGWFVWDPADGVPDPVLLVGGGSGVAPLMAMVRARRGAPAAAPLRLLHSVRAPDQRWYAAELDRLAAEPAGPVVDTVYTRRAPPGAVRPPGRLTLPDLERPGWRAQDAPRCFVCGPTAFVEAVSGLLVEVGHPPDRIRTERFG